MRTVFGLPARLGGLGILNPVEEANYEYENSRVMTQQLTDAIYQQHHQLSLDPQLEEQAAKTIADRKVNRINLLKERLEGSLSADMLKIIKLSAEKGTSIWLTSLPERIWLSAE